MEKAGINVEFGFRTFGNKIFKGLKVSVTGLVSIHGYLACFLPFLSYLVSL